MPPEAFQPTVDLAKAGQLAPLASTMLADLELARATAFDGAYEHPQLVDLATVRGFLEPVIGSEERARQFERLLVSLDPGDLLAVEPALRGLRVPTLLVWGTDDANFDVKWAYWLRDTIPGVCEVVEVEGARLFFPQERPADLVAHLRRHWATAA